MNAAGRAVWHGSRCQVLLSASPFPACMEAATMAVSLDCGGSGRRPAGYAAYASSRPAISDIRWVSISGSRSENGRKPNRA